MLIAALATGACAADDPITAGSNHGDTGFADGTPPQECRDGQTFGRQSLGDLEAGEVDLEPVALLQSEIGEGPIDAALAPNGEWWVAERIGQVSVVDLGSGSAGDVLIDISAETVVRAEEGLLGMTVDDTAMYLYFTDLDGDAHLDAWLLDSSGRPGERHRLLSIDQPHDDHNGGGLVFGPDGLLYIAVGDGGWQTPENGQDPQTLLGSILRIRPTPGAANPYEIPADNPYTAGGGAPEVFLIGVRNPWRFSFDTASGDLWVADVGLHTVEEVTLLPAADGWGLGANLGWDLREGTLYHSGERPPGNVDPVFEYCHDDNSDACAVIGGHVYRGSAIPELFGSYVFADRCISRIWALSIVDGTPLIRDFGEIGHFPAAFALDSDNELLVLHLNGPIQRIVPAAAG